MKRSTTIFVASITAAMLFSGCSSSSGGDTTCKDFLSHDKDKQTADVKTMLKNEHGGKEPSNGEVTLTKVSVLAFCKTKGKDSSKISDINHG